MTKDLTNLSSLNCNLSETSLNCSIKLEHEPFEWQEDIQCNIRFHGSHYLSPTYPIQITRDSHIQMNIIYDDIGEIRALEIELVTNKDSGLFIKLIEINIPKKLFVQKFDVQRWLHPKMGDGRTRLILTPNRLPGYEPKKMLEDIQQPKRDYVKYTFFIEISKTKGNIDDAILSINLIGRYGRTSLQPLNIKSGKIISLKLDVHSNIFELTMLDIGLLNECELKLENKSSYFITKIIVYREQYYEIDIHQWIETDQIITKPIQILNETNTSILLNRIK